MKEFEVYLFGDVNPMEETVKAETLEELKEKVLALSDEFYAVVFVSFDEMKVYVGELQWSYYQFEDKETKPVCVEDVVRTNGEFELVGPHGKFDRKVKANTLEELEKAMNEVSLETLTSPVVELESETMFVGDTEWSYDYWPFRR